MHGVLLFARPQNTISLGLMDTFNRHGELILDNSEPNIEIRDRLYAKTIETIGNLATAF
jgi:hypothetical protein